MPQSPIISNCKATANAFSDGALVTLGTKADTAWASGSGSVVALLKACAAALNKLIFGTAGSLLTASGINSTLNITAASVVKASAGRACKVIIVAPGSTSGAFTLNDAATTGAAAAANVIWTLPYNGAANVAGAVFNLDIPVTNGLVVSAVPGSGSPILAIVWN
jgi:hypothetical protein